MTEPLAFLDGEILPQSHAHLGVNDAGFVFGATVADLCRTFQHRLYRWPEHLARFRIGCQSAFIDVPMDDGRITALAGELVAHNARLIDANADLALVIFATPGPIGYYLGQAISPGEQPTLGMHTFPLPFQRYRPWIEHGVKLATPATRAIPIDCIDPHIKQRSRLHAWIAQKQMPGDAQPLLLDHSGNVTETAFANFLMVRDGTLISPPRDRILEGISLGVVGELADRLGIEISYRPIALAECYQADEALLTGTAFCLAGVRQLNDRPIPWPGPVMRRLLDAWNAEVGRDIHGQFR